MSGHDKEIYAQEATQIDTDSLLPSGRVPGPFEGILPAAADTLNDSYIPPVNCHLHCKILELLFFCFCGGGGGGGGT